jgi:hypothetical protein
MRRILRNNQEPECEVYSENRSELEALRGLFAKERRALDLLQHSGGQESTGATQVLLPLSDKKENLPFDEGNKKVVDEIDDGSLDSSIQAAINEIQKEASRIDLVIALDQLQTLESENNAAKISLNERSMEADVLRGELEEMEEKVSGLTLERDLLEADAKNLKEDLETCVERMFEISCVAGNSSFAESNGSSVKENNKVPEMDFTPPTPVLSTDLNFCEMFKSKAFEPNHETSMVMETVREAEKAVSDHDKHEKTVLRKTAETSIPIMESRSLPINAPEHQHSFSSTSVSISNQFSNEGHGRMRKAGNGQTKKKSATTERIPQQWQNKSRHVRRSKSRGGKICEILRRNCQRLACSSQSKEIAAMRQQLNELHSMTKMSLYTSEKLRKRLSMIVFKYEDIICKLRKEVAELKTEKIYLEKEYAGRR